MQSRLGADLFSVNLDQLCILQLDKSIASPESSGADELSRFLQSEFAASLDKWLRVKSCLRVLWIYPGWIENQGVHLLPQFGLVAGLPSAENSFVSPPAVGLRYFRGSAAYSHLLRVACGLESKVLGETDIFGQVKTAWAQALGRAGASAHLDCLSPWIQRCFEDVKEVRTRYLQNLGGVSYGSLVRKVIQTPLSGNHGSVGKSVLIVGAGQIASSVAPYLWDRPLKIWNRSAEGLARIESELRSLAGRFKSRDSHGVTHSSRDGTPDFHTGPNSSGVTLDLTLSTDPDVELQWWKECRDVVVAIPFDPSRDSARLRSRMDAKPGGDGNGSGKVIHLGGLVSGLGTLGQDWGRLPGFVSLDQVFEISQQQTELRSFQVEQAARACDERAKLRSIGNSISIPHGWEDLALFA